MNMKKTTLALAVSFALSQNVMAAADRAVCNANDDLSGWGVWCGVELFLAKLEKPAAGPGAEPEVLVLAESDITDTDPFGGELGEGVDEYTGPIYYWASHTHTDYYGGEGYYDNYDNGGVRDRIRDQGGDDWPFLDYEGEGGPTGIGVMELNADGEGASATLFDMDGNPVDSFAFNNEGDYMYDTYYDEPFALFGGEGYTGDYDAEGGQGMVERVIAGGIVYEDEAEMLKQYWIGYHDRYTDEVTQYWDEEDMYYYYGPYYEGSFTHTLTGFAGGEITPLADIEALRGDVVARGYLGFSQLHFQQVMVDVNFGTQTFEANVDGYIGGHFHEDNGFDGSFTAQGVIDGQHLVAGSSGFSGEGVISGSMTASFIGPEAVGMAGAYEVTKDAGQFNDVFVAVEESIAEDIMDSIPIPVPVPD